MKYSTSLDNLAKYFDDIGFSGQADSIRDAAEYIDHLEMTVKILMDNQKYGVIDKPVIGKMLPVEKGE